MRFWISTATSSVARPRSTERSFPIRSLTQVVTMGKGQKTANNAKVSHVIWGHIVDPGSLGDTAHRIEVCTGTQIDARVINSDVLHIPRISGSDGLECSPYTGCSGVIDVNETYKVISADGRDRDSITFIPR